MNNQITLELDTDGEPLLVSSTETTPQTEATGNNEQPCCNNNLLISFLDAFAIMLEVGLSGLFLPGSGEVKDTTLNIARAMGALEILFEFLPLGLLHWPPQSDEKKSNTYVSQCCPYKCRWCPKTPEEWDTSLRTCELVCDIGQVGMLYQASKDQSVIWVWIVSLLSIFLRALRSNIMGWPR